MANRLPPWTIARNQPSSARHTRDPRRDVFGPPSVIQGPLGGGTLPLWSLHSRSLDTLIGLRFMGRASRNTFVAEE